MCSCEAVFSPQGCPVTARISLSQCVHRMGALTPARASLAVWVSRTISLSSDLVSPRIPVILTSAPKTKGRPKMTSLFQPRPDRLSTLCGLEDESVKWVEKSSSCLSGSCM